MLIRKAAQEDWEAVAAVEAACFPAAEAATAQEFRERLQVYAEHFLLLFEGEKLIAFVDGMVTDAADLTDAMYADAGLHDENGRWQMLFGLNTLPEYRCRGYAALLMRAAVDKARKEKRAGVVLTCKEQLVHYYAEFGFVDEGVSASTHGNAVWHQMRLTF